MADRWILSRSSRLAAEVDAALRAYRFDEAAGKLYQFAWHELCDWYLELSKTALGSSDPAESRAARATLFHVMERLLRMLHPLMPFITEELWQGLPKHAGAPVSVSLAAFPAPEPDLEDREAEEYMQMLMETVVSERNLKATLRLPANAPIEILPLTALAREHIGIMPSDIRGVTGSSSVTVATLPYARTVARAVTSNTEIAVALEGIPDLDGERSRLRKEIERLSKELGAHDAKLSNRAFLERAKTEAVEKVRAAHSDLSERLNALRAILTQLGG